jgi:hypothetical protein
MAQFLNKVKIPENKMKNNKCVMEMEKEIKDTRPLNKEFQSIDIFCRLKPCLHITGKFIIKNKKYNK